MQPVLGTAVSRMDDFAGEPPNYWSLGQTGGIGAPGGANEWGAWVELDPSTLADYDGFVLHWALNSGGSAARIMVELGVGAASSETAIAGPFPMGGQTYRSYGSNIPVPVFIPRGSRISARFRMSTTWPASEHPIISLGIVGHRPSGERRSFGQWSVAALDLANTNGSVTLPSTYLDTAWREVIASTPFRVRFMVLCSFNGAGNTYPLEIGVGASSSEVPVVQVLSNSYFRQVDPLVVDIPAGSRIAVRGIPTGGAAMGTLLAHLFG